MNAIKKISIWMGMFVAIAASGCGSFFKSYTEEITGNVTVVFINETDARASFTFGSYNPLELDPPAAGNIQQTRLENHTTSNTFNVVCNRTVAIATGDLVERVQETNGDDISGFDFDSFNADVNFSNAPIDSEAAALPTVGVAQGVEVRLGVDFKCGDQLLFTFQKDSAATGGFKILFSVIPAKPEEN